MNREVPGLARQPPFTKRLSQALGTASHPALVAGLHGLTSNRHGHPGGTLMRSARLTIGLRCILLGSIEFRNKAAVQKLRGAGGSSLPVIGTPGLPRAENTPGYGQELSGLVGSSGHADCQQRSVVITRGSTAAGVSS